MEIEFISERKVVKTCTKVDEALKLVQDLRTARTKDESSLKAVWKNVGELLPIDPFLKLSIRVKVDGKIVEKKTIWNASL